MFSKGGVWDFKAIRYMPSIHRSSSDTLTEIDRYSGIDKDTGLPMIGKMVQWRSCLVAMVTYRVYIPPGSGGDVDEHIRVTVTDSSVYVEMGEDGVIESVRISQRTEPFNLLNLSIVMLQSRHTQLGDKVAPRHAQKATIAEFLGCGAPREEDALPYRPTLTDATTALRNRESPSIQKWRELQQIKESIQPFDGSTSSRFINSPTIASGPNKGTAVGIWYNALFMPSRLTISMMYEEIISLKAMYTGTRYDGTVFIKDPIRPDALDAYRDELAEFGFDDGLSQCQHENSDQTVTVIPNKLFISPCYVPFLPHTSMDKIQYRTHRADKDPVTRQPVSGRPNMGGLRNGGMEMSAFVAHGVSKMFQNQICWSSDLYMLPWCKSCNGAIVNVRRLQQYPDQPNHPCQKNPLDERETIHNQRFVVMVKIPFILLILMSYIAVLGITMTLKVEPIQNTIALTHVQK